MPDIKTRATVEKSVKTIDKSAIAAQRMKSAYVQAKEKAERSVPADAESPEGYAADRVSDGMNAAASESVHQLDRQGRRGIEATKENLAKAKERFQRKRLTDPLKKRRQKAAGETARQSVETSGRPQRAANPIRRPAAAPKKATAATRGEQRPIKTVERAGKTVKQSARSTGKATAKIAKGTVKTAQKSVKTAEKTAKTAIKTSQQAAKAAQHTAQATARAAKATAQAARVTAKATAAAAKAAAKATAAAVKAIIAAAKALIAAIAAGGWVAVVVIVIICLIGLIVCSPFGIFFSGEDSGTGQTMPTVVREINQDYENKLDEIKNGNAHDVLEMSGSRAVWSEVLAVYAVKTTTGPDDPQEVATMDDAKRSCSKKSFGR